MEWFGITALGDVDPIKRLMRCDYQEPTVQPDLLHEEAAGRKVFVLFVIN